MDNRGCMSDTSKNLGPRGASVSLSPRFRSLDLYGKSTQQGICFQCQAVVPSSHAKSRTNPYLCQQLLHPKKNAKSVFPCYKVRMLAKNQTLLKIRSICPVLKYKYVLCRSRVSIFGLYILSFKGFTRITGTSVECQV